MKKMLLVVFVSAFMFSAVSVYAGENDHRMMNEADHRMMNENGHQMMTVADAKKLPDKTMVMLSGTIVKHLRGDHFELKDGTGSVDIDVDDDSWRSKGLKVGDQVKVMGEVDTHTNKSANIDVIKIEKMANQKDKWLWYNQH